MYAAIVTMLTAALGTFMKGTIMLTSTHKDQMAAMIAERDKQLADKDKQLADAMVRIEDERRRADRWTEIGMKATGVSDGLIDVAKSRERNG
jgi:hypothetical protein